MRFLPLCCAAILAATAAAVKLSSCPPYLDRTTCAAVRSNTTGAALCEFCVGNCYAKSEGRCCQPPADRKCVVQSASDWGPCASPKICVNATVPYGEAGVNCSWTLCCPADKLAICPEAGCYNSQTEQCCEQVDKTRIAPKSAVCCPSGLCPAGTTCCGHDTNHACCRADQDCVKSSFYNFCRDRTPPPSRSP